MGNNYSNMILPTRFVIVADSHGDQIDEVAKKAVLNFVDDFQPKLRIHLGDAFDFRNLRKGASDDEKLESLERDWEMGEDFLRTFYAGGKRNVFLFGNHDDRLIQLGKSTNGVLRDYANDGLRRLRRIFKSCHATTLPYDARLGVYHFHQLKAVHGYFTGKNSAARHGAVYGNVFFGHVHSVEAWPIETVDGPREARGIGCLARLDMDYDQRQPSKLRHNNGFVYGVINRDGSYSAFQACRVGDDFLCATKFQRY